MFTRRTLMTRALMTSAVGLAYATASAEPATRSLRFDFRAEADAMRRFAERTHPRGLEASQDETWRMLWSNLAERAPDMDETAYVAAARRALGWFGDGHTTVLPFEFLGGPPQQLRSGAFGLALPLRARPFDDGLWVVAAKNEAAPLLGRRITHVEGNPIETLVTRFCELWPAENPAWGHNWSWLLLSSWGVLKGYVPVKEMLARGLDHALTLTAPVSQRCFCDH